MPGTVKSGLLPDADRSHKCDRQEEVCRWQNLPLDNDHFITEAEVRAFRAMRECLSLLGTVENNLGRLRRMLFRLQGRKRSCSRAAARLCDAVIGKEDKQNDQVILDRSVVDVDVSLPEWARVAR